MRYILLILAALTLAACDDGKSYDDEALGGPALQIEVYRRDPPPVDESKYSILDLSETVSEPTNFVPPANTVEPAPLLQAEEREPDTFGASILKALGMSKKDAVTEEDVPVTKESEYERGRQFAKKNGIQETIYCRGTTVSFVDGCVDYVLDDQ